MHKPTNLRKNLAIEEEGGGQDKMEKGNNSDHQRTMTSFSVGEA